MLKYQSRHITLSFKSSTILRIGGTTPDALFCRTCLPKGRPVLPLPKGNLRGNSGWRAWISGVGGVDSPGTAVVGRKREAMTTR